MKALQVISTLLLIGVLASVINAQWEGELLGTAVVRHNPYARNSSNILCYGVFLKSWIVLTAASCVKDKKANDLAVDLSFKVGEDIFSNYPVLVREFTLHPKFTKPLELHDFALMLLNTVFDWSVEPFIIPKRAYTSDFFTKDKIDTYYDLFADTNAIVPVTVREKTEITTEYGVCKGENHKAHYFCVKTSGTKTFKPEYKGAPLFFRETEEDNQKRLFGLYTGLHVNEAMPGHLFLKVYESVAWMNEYMKTHNKPPLKP